MGKLDVGRDFITKNISPINTAVFFTTGILVPLLDLMRPALPILNYAAVVVVVGFLVLVVVKVVGRPRPVPMTLLATVGICTLIFAAGAYASSLHDSGFMASSDPALARVQASVLGIQEQTAEINKKLDTQSDLLKDIRSGKSEDPRVALKNMGISWEFSSFREASQRGDLRAMELFLQGGMTTKMPSTNFTLPGLAVQFDHEKIATQLELFAKYGFDLKSSKAVGWVSGSDQPPTLYALARQKNNKEASYFLEAHGFKPADYDDWVRLEAAKRKAIQDKMPKGYFF